jgi:hypothetical protein
MQVLKRPENLRFRAVFLMPFFGVVITLYIGYLLGVA